MRYINFRYTDQKVVPDPLTGYYPYDNMKYGSFLNKKGDKYLYNSAAVGSVGQPMLPIPIKP